MKPEIHTITLGVTNCYLIKEAGFILVDSGSLPKGKRFLKELAKKAIDPWAISLVFLTHGHFDHIAGVNQIKKATGAQIAINHREKEWVEKALKPIPPGLNIWGNIFNSVMKLGVPFINFSPTDVDISLPDAEFSLEPFGIRGSILHTPGHTDGSMSLLLENGDAFVGDLTMNGLPLRIGPGMPIFAESAARVKESWKLLIAKGAQKIYPAHGNPFSAEVLKQLI